MRGSEATTFMLEEGPSDRRTVGPSSDPEFLSSRCVAFLPVYTSTGTVNIENNEYNECNEIVLY